VAGSVKNHLQFLIGPRSLNYEIGRQTIESNLGVPPRFHNLHKSDFENGFSGEQPLEATGKVPFEIGRCPPQL